MTSGPAAGDGRADVWAHALERASLGVWDWNLQTGTCVYSDTWFRMLGYEPGELIQTGDLWVALMHPDDRERAIASGDRHLRGEASAIETEMRLRHKKGHWIWVLDRGGVVERDEAGRPTRVVGVQTDITRQKSAELALARVKERFELALDASRTGIWYFDIASQTSFWDGHTREIFGLSVGEGPVPQNTWHAALHPADSEEAIARHTDPGLFDHGEMQMRYRIVRADGEVRHVETLAKFSPDPQPAGSIVGSIRDVTDEVLAAEALKMEEKRLLVTLASISDGVVSTDRSDRITFANGVAAEMLSRSVDELAGVPAAALFHQHDELEVVPGVDAAAQGLIVLPGKDGQGILVRCASNSIRDASGETLGMVHTLQDVTSEQRKQQELARDARCDQLTGLYNRRAFEETLEAHMAQAGEAPFALLYIDLDHFKALNDFAGHAAGDRALTLISQSIVARLPAKATVARLGGDEFAAIVPISATEDASRFADAVLAAIRAADLGQNASYRRLGASVGIVVVDESGAAAADVLAHADDACYAAKSAGRNCSIVHREAAGQLASRLTAARLVGEIADAREEGCLILYGQEIRPIAAANAPAGKVEVLARLMDRNGTIIPPGEFIPAAERFGHAAALDRWIIAKGLSDFAPAIRTGKLVLGFNLSAQTLSDPRLWEFVEDLICRNGLEAEKVAFEITETAAVTNFDAAERFVLQARRQGCRISLDDFGAGLSSFDYLRRFPVDSLKINGSFVENLPTSRFDRQIVASISRVAKALGYDVIAEKIENEETVRILADMRVKFGQGYLFHKPEPLDTLLPRLISQHEDTSPAVAAHG